MMLVNASEKSQTFIDVWHNASGKDINKILIHNFPQCAMWEHRPCLSIPTTKTSASTLPLYTNIVNPTSVFPLFADVRDDVEKPPFSCSDIYISLRKCKNVVFYKRYFLNSLSL